MYSRRPFLIVSVILVIILGWFTFYYVQASSTISTNKAKITSLTKDNTALGAALTEANSRIVESAGQIDNAGGQVLSLGSQLTAAKAESANLTIALQAAKDQATSLQTQLQAATTNNTALQGQVSSLTSQVATVNAQVTTLTSQASTLQTQLDTANALSTNLQGQVTSLTAITNLGSSTTLVTSLAASANSTVSSTVASFTAAYAGLVQITGTSTTNGFITVTDSFVGYPLSATQFPIATGTIDLKIPVLPGTVSVIFGASGNTTATATISAIYIY